jgi:hypothetical protein
VYLTLKFLLVSTLIFSCTAHEKTPIATTRQDSTIDSSPLMLSISIPQNSGLAFVNYSNYTVENDKLFVIDRRFNMSLNDSTDNYISDTTAVYELSESQRTELESILSSIDSLGHHSAHGCHIQMGWPRFFIGVSIEGKEMSGFIANCYREHIFQLVDYLNGCYPKGNVINYSKEDLIETEKDCKKYNFGINEDK